MIEERVEDPGSRGEGLAQAGGNAGGVFRSEAGEALPVETSGRMGLSREGFCLEHLIQQGGLSGEDCFHYSVQSGSELDLVALHRGATVGFEFKHADAPRITPRMSVATTDLGINRVYVVYPGPETFALDEERRFVALAWGDLARLQAGEIEG